MKSCLRYAAASSFLNFPKPSRAHHRTCPCSASIQYPANSNPFMLKYLIVSRF